MIISASRRTDIPTYYSEWFFNRLEEGYVLVRNPMNIHQISKISLNPDIVDGIVFWTKNPIPMFPYLERLKNYTYYFQFTLNAYGDDVEEYVPSKNKVIIPAFQRLSDLIGPEKVIWRYDPIFVNEKYSVSYHIHYFEELAKRLSPFTTKCIISFLDFYRNTEKNIASLSIKKITPDVQEILAKSLSEIAKSYGLTIDTCAESIDLQKYGINHAKCIDDKLFSKLLNCPLKIGKDKNQRLECGCVESIDIGTYNTCMNRCKYCYANYSSKTVLSNYQKHDPNSPLLIGSIGPDDKITERKVHSCRLKQIEFKF